MNDKSTNSMNHEDENIAQKLDRVAGQTNINAQFASELEERLRNAHRPKVSWFASSFKQVSPALRWVGLAILLGLVLNWSIRSLSPAPQPAINGTPVTPDTATPTPDIAINETATPVADDGGYDWRGTKLYLEAPLPELPTEANVYLLKPDQHATVDEALALAQRFGIEGKVYQAPDNNGYLVSDGKQRLFVGVGADFDYYPDFSPSIFMSGSVNISQQEAHTAIDAFLKSHGFDFEYRIENENAYQIPGLYYVLPLTPDGLTIRHEHGIPARMEFLINKDGQVAAVQSYLVNYNTVGTYSIHTAEEAFQQVLGSSDEIQNGVLENTRSGEVLEEIFWERSYPDHQTITFYGQPISYPSIIEGQPPLVSIDQYVVQGNIDGLDKLEYTFTVEAMGQFNTENGIRTFNVETWKISDATDYNTPGSLRRKADGQVVLWIGGGKEYPIPNAPEDAPLNTVVSDENPQLWVGGLMTEEGFFWKTIQYFPNGARRSGGGGGGSGTGFYKLNLSGTPVPFPTPQPETNQGTVEYTVKEGDTLFAIAGAHGITPEKIVQANSWLSEEHVLMPGKTLIIPGVQPIQSIIGQRIEGLRGIITMTTYRKPEGSQRIEYGFTIKPNGGPFYFATLEGIDLQNLQVYHNRPIDIWGTIDHIDQIGYPVIKVERYDIPFPDLKIELLQGKQRMTKMDGQETTLFTESDGTTYAQLDPAGGADASIIGLEGGDVILEALAIPGETFGSYPALRVFSSALAINPKDNQPTEITITANQPYIMDEPPIVENHVPPAATIEKVELVYYVPNPLLATPDQNSGPQNIQPAWRFYGHYSNGDEFEILVQALKQEYLLPELAPYTPPG